MKFLIITAICLLTIPAFGQLSLVQPQLKPNGKIVYFGMDNQFEVEGEEEIVEVKANLGKISNVTKTGFTYSVGNVQKVPITFIITYKLENGTTTTTRYPVGYRTRGLPDFPVLLNGAATGTSVPKRAMESPRLVVFEGHAAFKATPRIMAFNLIKKGKNTEVVSVMNGDYSTKEYKKFVSKLEAGDEVLFSEIKISVNGAMMDALPLELSITK